MTPYAPYLRWIETQAETMRSLLQSWANLNTGTFNPLGLTEMAHLVEEQFRELTPQVEQHHPQPAKRVDEHGNLVPLQLGPNVSAICRPQAPLQVLLAIHMDTVYGPLSPFQSVTRLDANTLQGPGVADAKGGLIVMLFSLKAFERFAQQTGQNRLGWNVIVNSDEEIGSPGSASLFAEFAKCVQLGLLFEPSLPTGGLVSSRKGSGNFAVIVHGQSAHSGRDFHLGRNAIVAAAMAALDLHRLNGRWPEMTLNVARVDGGGPSNMIPALAVLHLNIRYTDRRQEAEIQSAIAEILNRVSEQQGVAMQLQGEFSSPPKSLTPSLESQLQQLHDCGKELGLDLTWSPSGGSCDGNRLAALGIPNVDTLGVRGGKIHSADEFVLLDSLVERAKLTALYLMKLADGIIVPPAKKTEPA